MKSLLCAGAMLALTLPAFGQDHSAHGTMASDSPATAAYEAANSAMHENMMMDYSGDADADFIKSMIPHHQGAVDMAKIVLQYGTDPEVKKLAEDIIAAQEAELSWMKAWLAKKACKAAASCGARG